MSKKLKVTVSTCGTSLLTNKATLEERDFLRENANKKEEDYSPSDATRLKELAEKKRQMLLEEKDEAKIRRLSAELNGFIGCYRRDGDLSDARRDDHYLICTDTFQGHLAAEIIEEWGRSRDINMNVLPIEDLNAHSMDSFQLGIANLAKWCSETLPGYRNSHHVLFNMVGGFKSLQGYMQTLGMFYADEIIYIFESGEEILSIPRLPMDLDQSVKSSIEQNLSIVRRLQWISLSVKDCPKLPEVMLTVMDDECTLSVWGELMLDKFKDDLYRVKLLPPPLDCIRYSEATESAVVDMAHDKKILVNRRIDDLARYLELDHNIARLDFKPLKGDPKPPSTHEFDLWSIEDAWRGFCHYEDEGGKRILVIDSMGKGLH
ncbi:MAG: CRISPR-associated protein [Fretibacterium sp.]|nr:CRISPR-associated protein [Fretibacterium sp.]